MPRNGLRRPELNPGLRELRTMPRCVLEPSDDVTIYLVLEDFGQLGRAFLETDVADADRETVIRSFISGQYQNALRVAFNTAEGWSRDVSEDIAGEVLERGLDVEPPRGHQAVHRPACDGRRKAAAGDASDVGRKKQA
jgi:hypothetical protein